MPICFHGCTEDADGDAEHKLGNQYLWQLAYLQFYLKNKLAPCNNPLFWWRGHGKNRTQGLENAKPYCAPLLSGDACHTLFVFDFRHTHETPGFVSIELLRVSDMMCYPWTCNELPSGTSLAVLHPSAFLLSPWRLGDLLRLMPVLSTPLCPLLSWSQHCNAKGALCLPVSAVSRWQNLSSFVK